MNSTGQVTKKPDSRAVLLRRALLLEYLGLGWSAAAGTGAVVTGLSTGSVALLGFGINVALDLLASSILVWRFRGEAGGASQSEETETKATRGVAFTLLAAGLYIAFQAARSLLTQAASGASPVGTGISVLSVFILPPLAAGKLRLAAQLQNVALRGDGILTAVGAFLAAATLLGVLLNTRLGWWWADPCAALLTTGVLLREGGKTLHLLRSTGAHRV